MTVKKNRILNKEEVQQKIDRIAYEILEDNYEEKKILLIGIKERGFLLAKQLQKDRKSVV